MINLKKIIFVIENITLKVGRTTSWLILFMTLIAFSVALLRYFFNIGFVWMQESYIWMHGLVFLFGSAYTLLEDKHVRVDIFYRNFNEKYKAFVNIFFSIFFIFPFIFIISKYSIPYILKSWASLEKSREAGGLQFLYLYKTSIILFCFFLFIQSIALILRCVLVICKKKKMTAQILSICMFATTFIFLLFGFPVAFTLAGTAILFALTASFFDFLSLDFLALIPSRIFGTMTNELLVAVPLFIFMGLILEKSKIAEELLETIANLFGKFKGGLGFTVIIVGALLSASTGIVGATVVTMGLLTLPTMLKWGYDKKLASGLICASGTLGQIIPPSIVLILLSDALQGAYSQSQLLQGKIPSNPISTIDLFAGAILPGILLVIFYCLWQLIMIYLKPQSSPALINRGKKYSIKKTLSIIFLPIILIILVLGSILMGVATPTEAASFGAVGAIVLSFIKKSFSSKVLSESILDTTKISSMIFLILIGAKIFSLVFIGLEGREILTSFINQIPGGSIGAMLFVMILIFVLGFFLDFIQIVFTIIPIVGPIILQMDINPLWFGIMIAVNLQTSFLTPPFGFALFYFRGIAPNSIKTIDIYKGVLPFVIIQIIVLLLIAAFPEIALWLPEKLY